MCMEYGNGKKNDLIWKTTENRYHNDTFNVDEENENVNVSILAKQVFPKSTLLDIGCGEGKLGKILKNKGCILYGVDTDPKALDYIQKNKIYYQVYNFNLEYLEESNVDYVKFLQEKPMFDYVALIDILEHIINPTCFFEKAVSFLKEHGKILISIPNINNADILLNLLNGRFNYQQSGILDNTHAKYFTKRSFIEWIDEMNQISKDYVFDCIYLGGTFGDTEYLTQVKQNMPMLYDFLQLNPDYHTIQHLFLLEKISKKDGQHLVNLSNLLQEEMPNLACVLNQYLTKGMDQKYLKKFSDTSILPNERNILTARMESAEKGWQQCAIQLEENRNGWKQCENKLVESQAGWKQCAKQLQEALVGWKQCELQLEKNRNGWKQCQIELQNVTDQWKQCVAALNETKEKLKLSDEGWKQCQIELQNVTDQWKQCVVALNETKEKLKLSDEGWKQCQEQLEKNQAGWQECNKKLIECEQKIEQILNLNKT